MMRRVAAGWLVTPLPVTGKAHRARTLASKVLAGRRAHGAAAEARASGRGRGRGQRSMLATGLEGNGFGSPEDRAGGDGIKLLQIACAQRQLDNVVAGCSGPRPEIAGPP